LFDEKQHQFEYFNSVLVVLKADFYHLVVEWTGTQAGSTSSVGPLAAGFIFNHVYHIYVVVVEVLFSAENQILLLLKLGT
jgi:hypothetical protein